VTGEVISGYWPGYAMLLTPFTLVNVPWLANPLLAALSLLVMCRLATDVFGSSRAVGWVLLFTLAAPAFTVNAISYYSMTSHLLFNATFALCLIRPTVLRAFLAGLVGSYALILHNPFPHALFAAPWIVWLALQRDRMRLLGSLAAGYLPVAVVLGIGWALLTGQVLGTHAFNLVGGDGTFIASWTARVERIFQLPGLALLNARAIGLAKLWLWTGPAVLAIALIGAYRQRSNVYVRLLTLSAVTTFAGFLFVPFDQGHGWGFRYFHSAWFVLPILSAGAFAANAREDASAQRLRGYVAACAVLSLCAMTTLRAVQVRAFMDHHLAQLPTVDGGRPRIVIVNPSLGYYAWDLVQNDPFLRTPAIRMITHGRKVDEAMMAERFPDMKLLDRSYKGTVWGPSRGSSGAPAGPEPASP
jgi:hypothetical protein